MPMVLFACTAVRFLIIRLILGVVCMGLSLSRYTIVSSSTTLPLTVVV